LHVRVRVNATWQHVLPSGIQHSRPAWSDRGCICTYGGNLAVHAQNIGHVLGIGIYNGATAD
jgi:hypothetical protein